MERKVAQTELDPAEYETLVVAARKSGLTLKEALRQAALRWATEESGIDPKDPIFDIAPGRKKPLEIRLKGEALSRGNKASGEVGRAVYGGGSIAGALAGLMTLVQLRPQQRR